MTEGGTRGAIFTRGAIDETTVRIVDALFRHFAKQVSPKKGISIEDAIDASWLGSSTAMMGISPWSLVARTVPSGVRRRGKTGP
jgi:hypothetical protein